MAENIMYLIVDDNDDLLHIADVKVGDLEFTLPAILSDEQTALEIMWRCAELGKRPLHIEKVSCLMQAVTETQG